MRETRRLRSIFDAGFCSPSRLCVMIALHKSRRTLRAPGHFERAHFRRPAACTAARVFSAICVSETVQRARVKVLRRPSAVKKRFWTLFLAFAFALPFIFWPILFCARARRAASAHRLQSSNLSLSIVPRSAYLQRQ